MQYFCSFRVPVLTVQVSQVKESFAIASIGAGNDYQNGRCDETVWS
jgi:hypothetical protein